MTLTPQIVMSMSVAGGEPVACIATLSADETNPLAMSITVSGTEELKLAFSMTQFQAAFNEFMNSNRQALQAKARADAAAQSK